MVQVVVIASITALHCACSDCRWRRRPADTKKDENSLQLKLWVARRVISTFRIDLSCRELSPVVACFEQSNELSGSESGGEFHDEMIKDYFLMKYS